MKRLIAMLLVLILVLAACAPSDATETTDVVEPIKGYRTAMGWYEGNLITTTDGHIWEITNPRNYVGNVEVVFDDNGTDDVTDDKIILIRETD